MLSSFLLAVALLQRVQCHQPPIAIPPLPEDSNPVPNDLQSFSLEFCFFPDYAGNKTHPNTFSKNLLSNLERITGVPPAVRVGGTTQDHAIYIPDQKENVNLIFEDPGDDQPQTVKYGPSFFESYHTLGDNIPFSHGLNFHQKNATQQEESAIAACNSIANLKLLELGNEINMNAPSYRSKDYTLQDYIQEWNQRTANIKNALEKACPGNAVDFMAPTWIAGLFKPSKLNPNNWTLEQLFSDGFDSGNIITEICMHTYMDVNDPPYAPAALDLQATYMNHTNIVRNLAPHISRAKNLAHLGRPYVLGETNSMAKQGRPGVSNTFGNALWLVDFSFWAAEHNIHRLHFHQGLNYRYTSWQPITSMGNEAATRPNYYGQIMVASALGTGKDNRIVNIPLEEDTESAYALYNGTTGKMTKLAVVNFRAFNSSSDEGEGVTRPGREYTFKIPGRFSRAARIERLIAPGSDALGDVTFAGVSYDYELARGEPVVVDDDDDDQDEDRVEVKRIRNGMLRVDVPDSSAVLVTLI